MTRSVAHSTTVEAIDMRSPSDGAPPLDGADRGGAVGGGSDDSDPEGVADAEYHHGGCSLMRPATNELYRGRT